MKKDTLFLDVDTQYDFMRPEGRLYVAGAEGIIDSVSDTRRFALDNGYSIIASMDWHKEGNEELSDKPDFKHTFPPHCMAGKPGSERVGYLGKLPVGVVPNEKINETELHNLIANEQFHIAIRKEELVAFSNPNTDRILTMLKPKQAVIFGVALDLCVCQTAEVLLKLGGIKLFLLKDAVKGLGIKEDRVVIEELKNQGVEIISVADLKKKF